MPKKAIIVSLLIIVALAAVALFLVQQQKKIETPGNQIVKQEEATKNDPATNSYPQRIEVIPGTDEAWYNIPEYGVRMRLNKEFADDLKFAFSHERNSKDSKWDTIYFASEKLYATDSSCALGSLGVMSIFEGGFKKEDAPGATKIVSFPNLDIVFSDVPEAYKNQCSSPVHYKEISGAGAKSIVESMGTLQLIP